MTTLDSGTTGIDHPDARTGFRDPTRLTLWLKALLWASIGLNVIAFLSGIAEVNLLNDLSAGVTLKPGEADANDLRQGIIGGLQVALIIATIIVFARWIHRANYNARQLGAAGMTFSPGWAVGWYFIPFANLFKPYQAMKEIWQASADPTHWPDQPRGSILPWWWFLFLAAGVLGNMSLRMTLSANTLQTILAASSVTALSNAVDAVSAAVALALVAQIFRMQMAHHQPARAFSGEVETVRR